MPSTIQQQVTQNYLFQSLLTILSANKEILQNGINPNTEVFLQHENRTFEILRGNGYKYNFIYNFDWDDFLNASERIRLTEVISHDQITKNFGAPLVYFGGIQELYRRVSPNPFRQGFIQRMRRPIYKTATIGFLSNLPPVYSRQYSEQGITLQSYMQTVIDQLPIIISHCPDLTNVQEHHPLSYIDNYTYTDLLGQTTVKTASFTAIKYTQNGNKKVLFFGTGLQEFVVGNGPTG